MEKMTKTMAKEIARGVVGDAIASANYRICDSEEYTEESKELILQYVNQFSATAQKSIKLNPYTF